jgi:hypothetical protein
VAPRPASARGRGFEYNVVIGDLEPLSRLAAAFEDMLGELVADPVIPLPAVDLAGGAWPGLFQEGRGGPGPMKRFRDQSVAAAP